MRLILAENLGLSSPLIPLQRGRLKSHFEPGFSLILFLIFALKKKEPQRNEKQNENEEQKESLDKTAKALSFCGVGGVRTLVQTMNPNVFYMLSF